MVHKFVIKDWYNNYYIDLLHAINTGLDFGCKTGETEINTLYCAYVVGGCKEIYLTYVPSKSLNLIWGVGWLEGRYIDKLSKSKFYLLH